MRHNTQPSPALGRQLAEWRKPLDTAPDVEDAVVRMLRALESHLQRDQRGTESAFSPAAAS
jgi:hypothetical protein